MIEWKALNRMRPVREQRYLVFCPSADPDAPLYTAAWYHPDTGEWSLIHPYWASAITHWAELTPPED